MEDSCWSFGVSPIKDESRKEGFLPPELRGLLAPVVIVPFLLCPLQYALYKKMTQAAILIQSKFRSYYEQKRFQQSRRAAVLIQNFYRSYKKCGRRRPARRTAVIVQQKLRWVTCLQGAGEDLPGMVQGLRRGSSSVSSYSRCCGFV